MVFRRRTPFTIQKAQTPSQSETNPKPFYCQEIPLVYIPGPKLISEKCRPGKQMSDVNRLNL